MDGNLPEVDFTDGSPLIPEEALAALVVGVERGDHLVNLELLGLGQRTINLLEERGVTTIKALLHKTKEELLSFENFGKTALEHVFLALSQYHLLKEKEEEVEPMIPRRIVRLD